MSSHLVILEWISINDAWWIDILSIHWGFSILLMSCTNLWIKLLLGHWWYVHAALVLECSSSIWCSFEVNRVFIGDRTKLTGFNHEEFRVFLYFRGIRILLVKHGVPLLHFVAWTWREVLPHKDRSLWRVMTNFNKIGVL